MTRLNTTAIFYLLKTTRKKLTNQFHTIIEQYTLKRTNVNEDLNFFYFTKRKAYARAIMTK